MVIMVTSNKKPVDKTELLPAKCTSYHNCNIDQQMLNIKNYEIPKHLSTLKTP
jgi:hypothetical protein